MVSVCNILGAAASSLLLQNKTLDIVFVLHRMSSWLHRLEEFKSITLYVNITAAVMNLFFHGLLAEKFQSRLCCDIILYDICPILLCVVYIHTFYDWQCAVLLKQRHPITAGLQMIFAWT